ncbi:MAG TPA: hypothetical protein EYN70_10470 [Planctomycetaceae bacterium]|nr:hypothetical protein [Planctomycetaceae bacterium]
MTALVTGPPHPPYERNVMVSTRKIICTGCLTLGLILTAQPSQANFFDWLAGRAPTPWAIPATPVRTNRIFAWQPVTTTTTVPSVIAATPAPQAVVNYAPVTRYRTQWVQVPVTTYRPVFETNAQTGWPQLQMRACQRYVWQVRRVPVSVMRPSYRTNFNSIFPWCWNWTPRTNNCCAAQVGSITTASPQPYYLGPDAGQPVLALPPETNAPSSSGGAMDQVPTLPSQAPQLNTTPQDSDNGARDSSADLPESNGQSILRRPVDKSAPGLESSTPRVIAPVKTEPIPDLDRQPLLQNQGPQLLHPRDRTARSTHLNQWTNFGAIQWASMPPVRSAALTANRPSRQVIQQPAGDRPAPLRWERIQP